MEFLKNLSLVLYSLYSHHPLHHSSQYRHIYYHSPRNTIANVSNCCRPTSFLLIHLKLSLVYLNNSLNSILLPFIYRSSNVILSPVDSARNLGVIFDNNLSFVPHISSISKSCFLNIRDLRRIRNTIDQTTACTI